MPIDVTTRSLMQQKLQNEISKLDFCLESCLLPFMEAIGVELSVGKDPGALQQVLETVELIRQQIVRMRAQVGHVYKDLNKKPH